MRNQPVTVHYWSPRPFAAAKSLTGHVALEVRSAGVYASWAPEAGQAMGSIAGAVGPCPRPSYENDETLAGGTPSTRVVIHGLDGASIRAAWVGMATYMADPAVHGPTIGYQLAPGVAKTSATSCATLVVKLLRAGGADRLVEWRQGSLVTPRDVYDYAMRLRAK